MARLALHRPLLPLILAAFPTETRNFRDYDLILQQPLCRQGCVSSSRLAYRMYVHTPMRYVWDAYFNRDGRLLAQSGMTLCRRCLQAGIAAPLIEWIILSSTQKMSWPKSLCLSP